MSLESERDGDPLRPRLYDDPLAIRALAHPTRLALYLLVGREGPVTAAGAARQLDISQALASHHMRQLAKYGFVESAEPGDGRERPWQVTANSFSTVTMADSPELAAASGVLDEVQAERALANLIDWQGRAADWDPAWRDVTGVSHSLLYLTRDELAEFQREYLEMITSRARQRPIGDHAARPADAVPIDLTMVITPLPPTASGG